MALAVSVAPIDLEKFSAGVRLGLGTVLLDTSYPTGGSPGLRALLGLDGALAVWPLAAVGVLCQYIVATDLLKCWWTGAAVNGQLAEVTATTNLSALAVPFAYLAT